MSKSTESLRWLETLHGYARDLNHRQHNLSFEEIIIVNNISLLTLFQAIITFLAI